MSSQRVPFSIARRHGEAKSKFVSSQRLVNAFVEQDQETGEFSVHNGPGLSLFVSIDSTGDVAVRGLHDFNGILLAVVGDQLYTVTSTGTYLARGTVPGTDNVIMSNNGLQAVIVCAAASYVWDGATYAQITDPDFAGAGSVDFLDQYMIFTKPDTGAFFLSELADASAYDALDIASAESRPDNLVRVIVDNREAILMGTKTGEGWYNAGDADFPLVRDQTFVEVGLAGKYAIARIDNSIAWLASDKTVRILRSGSPQIISDSFIVGTIEAWTDAALTQCFSYTIRGHQFLALHNPDGCLLWDASMPAQLAWSSRASFETDSWRVRNCETMVDWNGRIIMGSAQRGELFTLDPNVFDEGGVSLIGGLVSRTIGPGGRPFTLNAVELEIEPGVSLASGDGSNAQVWMELSRDSGYTFGSRMERALGAIGDRERRIVWNDGYGQFPPHGGVVKIGWSDPVSISLTKGWADIETDMA